MPSILAGRYKRSSATHHLRCQDRSHSQWQPSTKVYTTVP